MHSRASLIALIALLTGCGGHGSTTLRDGESGLILRYPRSWTVTGFSRLTSPRRLVAASYTLTRDEVEGDCGGRRALESLPPGGAAVLLIDYGSSSVAPHFERFRLSEFKRADYECFGPSYALRFTRGGRDLQAHIALGRRAGAGRRQQALSILDSLFGATALAHCDRPNCARGRPHG